MTFPRRSGILLHPTSLPGRFGIGDLGADSYHFADTLAEAGQRLWQVLPLNPTGYGDSPYRTVSAFAGNPLLISPETLAEGGLLEHSDLAATPAFPERRVDYGQIIAYKMTLLRVSFDRFQSHPPAGLRSDFEDFCRQHASWLAGYSLFMAIKDAHHGAAWNTWEEGARRRQPPALETWHQRLRREVQSYQYQQYLFWKQWRQLQDYCHELGIHIVGDMPIYVDLDSADVWQHQELFFLDPSGRPASVAGVPPDYFSKTGQLWGNPLYRWELMAQDGYAWWVERFRTSLAMVDILRLDHFRGFEKYWEVPANEKTAVNGHWVSGPGIALFEALTRALGDLPVIAEDLGYITPEVHALRDQSGFPGMRVLQFAFGGDATNYHLPHSYPRHCVAYTGTHDNDTALGWLTSVAEEGTGSPGEEAKRFALKYLGSDGERFNWDLIRLALASVADTAIVPWQDVLGLGSEARMNTPGKPKSNWEWRFTWDMLSEDTVEQLREMTWVYGRAGGTSASP